MIDPRESDLGGAGKAQSKRQMSPGTFCSTEEGKDAICVCFMQDHGSTRDGMYVKQQAAAAAAVTATTFPKATHQA